MKPFTDAELNNLRLYPECVFDVDSFIARLDAAEVIAADHASIYPKDPAVARWNESKGESNG